MKIKDTATLTTFLSQACILDCEEDSLIRIGGQTYVSLRPIGNLKIGTQHVCKVIETKDEKLGVVKVKVAFQSYQEFCSFL